MNDHDAITILKFLAENELYDCVIWGIEENGELWCSVNCNDLFGWAWADTEDLTIDNLNVLEQSIKDCEQIDSKIGFCHAPSLFCCRIRQMRPQGVAYPLEKEYWPLFDNCGPKRDINLSNPYDKEEYRNKHPSYDKLLKFVQNSICECFDEYGNPLGAQCDRCETLGKKTIHI